MDFKNLMLFLQESWFMVLFSCAIVSDFPCCYHVLSMYKCQRYQFFLKGTN